jgi:hypothetical protein
MIQRIQTLYLFIVVVLGTLLCFFAPVTYVYPENLTEGSLKPLSEWPLAVITIAIPLIAAVDIFLYNKRILQARVNLVNAFLCLGWYAICFTYVWFEKQNFNVDWYVTIWAAIPLVCLVLTMMAVRRILRDEAMVRAADRIR